MAISGHLTRSVFDRYNIVTTRQLHAVMDRVQASAKAIELENDARTMKVLPSAKEHDK